MIDSGEITQETINLDVFTPPGPSLLAIPRPTVATPPTAPTRQTFILIPSEFYNSHLAALRAADFPTPTQIELPQHWISRWGTMRALLTDNGRQFTDRLLQQLTDIYGIKHIYSSPYKPRGNSVVESDMRTLKTTLKLCTQAFQADWAVALQAAALAYRATPHTVTGHTPFFLVTGQKVILPLSRE